MSTLPDVRRKDFKKGLSVDDCRRKRGESQNFLRKSKRNESLLKRRMMMTSSAETTEESNIASGSDSCIPPSIENLPKVKQILQTIGLNVSKENEEQVFEAAKSVRKLLSRATDPPVEPVIEAGLIQDLIQLLKLSDFPKIQFETAWALTNVGSTKHTGILVENGIIPLLVPLLMVRSDELREQAAWCLGNIAGDSADFRNAVLEANALQGLVANLREPFSLDMKRNTMWTLSNLCRGKPHPDPKLIAPLGPIVADLIINETDVEVLADACWSLTYLSDGEDSRIEYVVNCGVIYTLVELIKTKLNEEDGKRIITPALRTLGNILTGTDKQTQAVLDSGFLRVLIPLINHPKASIVKEACWAASNITAGTKEQIGSFLTMPNLPEAVVSALQHSKFEIKKEAHWAIANVCTNGSTQHVQCIVERYEVIPALCELLNVDDVKVVSLSLDALAAILKVDAEQYGEIVDECGGLDMIDSLQEHASENVYQKAISIIENYFQFEDTDDENANENAAPFGGDSMDKQFNFNPEVTQRQLNFGGSALQEKFVQ